MSKEILKLVHVVHIHSTSNDHAWRCFTPYYLICMQFSAFRCYCNTYFCSLAGLKLFFFLWYLFYTKLQYCFYTTLQEAETCSKRYNVSEYTIVSSDGSISVSINASADVNNYNVSLDSANAPNISRGLAYNISAIACIDISDTACNSNGCQESTQFCRESKTVKVCK